MDLNDTVQVTLTKEGAIFFNETGRDNNKKEGDTIKIQLWLLIKIFNKLIGWGQPVPFTNIEIVNE